MMEAFFQVMMFPSTDNQIAKKGKNIDRSDISNLSIPKQTQIFLEVLNEEAARRNGNYKFTIIEL